MKKYFLALISILLVTSAFSVTIEQTITATVLPPEPISINEFESNPSSGSEWIELYNPNTVEVDITGWKLYNAASKIFTIPDGTIILSKGFYVIDGISNKLNNGGENITLTTPEDIHIDEMLLSLKDPYGDIRTWQRIPDASSNWVFQSQTKGFLNTPLPIISDKSIDKSCILSSDNVTLKAKVTGFCIEQVTFSTIINNTQQNFTGVNIPGTDNYTTTLQPSLFHGNETIIWTVYTHDCFNRTEKDGDEIFKVNARTLLTISPSSPDGQNNWYITEPNFTLTNLDANQITYRWNGNSFTSTSPAEFKLEGVPNGGNITAGLLVLKYWSDVCSGEPEQNQTFHFDFTNPIIEKIIPTGKITNLKPAISAYLNEKYGTSSGIDISKVIIKLDNTDDVTNNTIITPVGTDAAITYTSNSDLSPGIHSVTINVTDKAGRNSQLTWTFEILSQIPPQNQSSNLTVHSPKNTSYSTRKILFNITTSQIVEKIEYINDAEKNPKWKILCKNCNEYGFTKKKSINLQDGENNIAIRATKDAIIFRENIKLFIDSQPPKIINIEPRNNLIVNGSSFQVKYTEENPVNIKLFWNPNTTLQNCPSGKNQICSTSVNLSAFNNQYIEYYFEISDGINTAESKKNKVFVDIISPQLAIILPQNETAYRSKVPFNITVTEKAEIEYYDLTAETKWVKLCTNCDKYGTEKIKTKRFSRGNHNLLIRAVDKAGNSDVKQVSFTA